MTTLNEAREAAEQLKKLQDAAQLLPALELDNSKKLSLSNLQSLKNDTRLRIAGLYEQYNSVYDVYMSKLNSLLETVKDVAQSFKTFVMLRRDITITAKRYVNAYVQHNLQYEGLNRYQTDMADLEATNEILSGLQLERPLSPTKGNPAIDTIVRLLEYF